MVDDHQRPASDAKAIWGYIIPRDDCSDERTVMDSYERIQAKITVLHVMAKSRKFIKSNSE